MNKNNAQAVIEQRGRWLWRYYVQDEIVHYDGGTRWGRRRAEKAARRLLADYLRRYYGNPERHVVLRASAAATIEASEQKGGITHA